MSTVERAQVICMIVSGCGIVLIALCMAGLAARLILGLLEALR